MEATVCDSVQAFVSAHNVAKMMMDENYDLQRKESATNYQLGKAKRAIDGIMNAIKCKYDEEGAFKKLESPRSQRRTQTTT